MEEEFLILDIQLGLHCRVNPLLQHNRLFQAGGLLFRDLQLSVAIFSQLRSL